MSDTKLTTSNPVRRSGLVLAACAGMLTASGPIQATPTFFNLGVMAPGGTYSRGAQVSADGWVVTGIADVNGDEQWGNRAFRWTLSGGLQNLGVPLGSPWSAGNSISADGSTVAGNLGVRPFRWTSSTGPQNLGTLPNGTVSIAYGVSGNGLITVGTSNDGSTYLGFRWTSAGGMQSLGTLPGGSAGGSGANGLSSDGSTIVGVSAWTGANGRAVRWTSAGIQNLGVLFGGDHSYAESASANGSVVAGSGAWVGDESMGDRAFRWTSATGMQNLGVPPGAFHSYGRVVSGDGLVVAGRANYSNFGSNYRACLWRASIGMVDLNTYLPSLGVNLAGWVLTEANGLSADGSAISGTGLYNGSYRAFLVRDLPWGSCYANCDGSTAAPALNVNDFVCFQSRFAAAEHFADCDRSGSLNVNDFVCFQAAFATGCP